MFHGGPARRSRCGSFHPTRLPPASMRQASRRFGSTAIRVPSMAFFGTKIWPSLWRPAPGSWTCNSESLDAEWKAAEQTIRKYAHDMKHRFRLAQLLADVLPKFARSPHFERYFEFFEQHGVHVTPVHFYQPIPDTSELTPALWQTDSELPGVDMNESAQLKLLEQVFPRFRDEYDRFPRSPTERPHEFYFDNPMFSGTDALALYCMVRHFRPRRIIEVGSGFSSLVSAQALAANGIGELTCIEHLSLRDDRERVPWLERLDRQKSARH